ncbi:hypothetical protein GGX14DRAFT_579776 [Mycena pura]|uniref:Uncharacterized protein n=1 Tax=Mycena pura TaxID=153505 RepID=A0AAD6XYA1_9AGAR|nr:hypothetical protein GGX14DRAFT_579776 [Mycena pura]
MTALFARRQHAHRPSRPRPRPPAAARVMSAGSTSISKSELAHRARALPPMRTADIALLRRTRLRRERPVDRPACPLPTTWHSHAPRGPSPPLASRRTHPSSAARRLLLCPPLLSLSTRHTPFPHRLSLPDVRRPRPSPHTWRTRTLPTIRCKRALPKKYHTPRVALYPPHALYTLDQTESLSSSTAIPSMTSLARMMTPLARVLAGHQRRRPTPRRLRWSGRGAAEDWSVRVLLVVSATLALRNPCSRCRARHERRSSHEQHQLFATRLRHSQHAARPLTPHVPIQRKALARRSLPAVRCPSPAPRYTSPAVLTARYTPPTLPCSPFADDNANIVRSDGATRPRTRRGSSDYQLVDGSVPPSSAARLKLMAQPPDAQRFYTGLGPPRPLCPAAATAVRRNEDDIRRSSILKIANCRRMGSSPAHDPYARVPLRHPVDDTSMHPDLSAACLARTHGKRVPHLVDSARSPRQCMTHWSRTRVAGQDLAESALPTRCARPFLRCGRECYCMVGIRVVSAGV